jgi:hypothetical protein
MHSDICYYINGKKQYEWEYLNRYLHGISRGWYENGQLEYNRTWKMDKIDGKSEYWNREGKLIFSKDYVLGYEKKYILIILRTLRKAKWIRLVKLTKTKAFNEWWYHPDNYGGKIAKKKLNFLENLLD